jgi:putative flippase GtrA
MCVWSVPIRLASVPARMRHLMSYGVIGAACACMSNFVIIASSLAGVRYWNAAALAFVLVTPLGYVLQSWLTFGVRLSMHRFLRFAGSVAIGAFLFVTLLGLFHGVCGMPIWIVSPSVTVVIFCWNYAASLWAVSCLGDAGLSPPVIAHHDATIRLPSVQGDIAFPQSLHSVTKHLQEPLKP